MGRDPELLTELLELLGDRLEQEGRRAPVDVALVVRIVSRIAGNRGQRCRAEIPVHLEGNVPRFHLRRLALLRIDKVLLKIEVRIEEAIGRQIGSSANIAGHGSPSRRFALGERHGGRRAQSRVGGMG